MEKTYYRKENILIWYILLALIIGLIIFGYVLIRYFVWQVIPLLIVIISKINTLRKNNISPIIILNEEGLTVVNPKLGNQLYTYNDITAIKIDSKYLNGYIKVKSKKFKIRIETVAIDLADQREIVAFVKSKIR
jgi:hypothetical protein